jgi:hypothetical protein
MKFTQLKILGVKALSLTLSYISLLYTFLEFCLHALNTGKHDGKNMKQGLSQSTPKILSVAPTTHHQNV